ncbi:Isochorismatase-like protein [Penicillium chrysogenum]|nr:Isochorismatase-like protein [Penicillium chrysogenum]
MNTQRQNPPADQCVGSTLQDAHAQGFDTVMLKDVPHMQKQPTSPAAPDAGGFLLAAGRALAKAADLDSQRKLTQASSNAF